MKHPLRPPLARLAIILAASALASGTLLLLLDCFAHFTTHRYHAAASALPLILIGLSWLSLHPGSGVHPIQFLKRLIAAVAFVLWGIDQMLPPGWLASTVGDVVIALFVLDMALIVRGELTDDPND
jgi:hypothetical protein